MYIRLIPHYILWHYTIGIRDYLRVMHLLLRAISKVFSLRLLFRTFFDPFERLGESYHGVRNFFETFIVNTLMRGVGIIVRTCVICIGLLALLFAFVFSVAGLLVWLCMPIIILTLLYIALLNIIKLL